jgi:hypothetical protein
MVTHYPHRIRTIDAAPGAPEARRVADGVVDHLITRLRQIFCGLHGHDRLLHFETDRMFLECVSCGHRSSGWVLDLPKPIVRQRGDARRHVLMRPHLVSKRRIA